MAFFLTWLILSVLVGVWAGNKGRSAFGFFLLSVLLSPIIGFIAVAIATPDSSKIEAALVAAGDSKKCPQCAELIKREAVKCRYCGAEQAPESTEKPKPEFYA